MLVGLSDVHLTSRFDRKKFNYLFNLIKGADQVALVGDWWDSRRCTFDEFLGSPWNNLFPLLRSRETVYLYGNHDPRERCDGRAEQFSVRQADELNLEFGTFRLHFEHGHRIAPDPIEKNHPGILKVPGIGHADYLFTELIPTSLFGERWINYRGRVCANLLKARSKEIADNSRWLVCGHSHLAELDPAIKYANCGFFGLGRAQYLRVDRYSIGVVKARY